MLQIRPVDIIINSAFFGLYILQETSYNSALFGVERIRLLGCIK